MKKKTFTSYEVVNQFEEIIADYSGSKYAVAVDSCCNAIFLCCIYKSVKDGFPVGIPRFTYPGVVCSIIHAGGKTSFHDIKWSGQYFLGRYNIIDSALRFKEGMYCGEGLMCLSFHAKKHLPIGRGGMILTDNKKAYEWFKKARFDGRSEVPLYKDKIKFVGWNMYMTPEQAARGLMLFDLIKDKSLLDIDWKTQGYPDLSKIKAYQ